MEPILNHPELTYLLSIWKFLTAHHQYLQLPEQVSDISLYELDEHVRMENYQTSFMQELIRALTQKTQGYQAKKKNKAGLFFMAKFNKYKIFDDLVKDSAYELALSQVNFSLQRRNLTIIPTLTPFQKLTLKKKYSFLSVLTDLVSNSHKFKREYMQNLKKDYSEALQKEGASKKTLNKDYQVKINSGYIMGTDSRHNVYYYIPKISDTIFSFNYRSGKWAKIQGVEEAKSQILTPLTKNGTIEAVAQCDLCQSVLDVWKNLESPSQNYAFYKNKFIFSTKEKARLLDKMEIMKNLFYEFESEYTKYVSDCWNCRWASKQKRRKLLNDVNHAQNMNDLVICFSDFFNSTKHSTHRKIKNFEFYDTDLKTDDVPQSQFKPVFLRVNYLYGKGVFSQTSDSTNYPINLFNHIKSFIQEPERHEAYIFQYLRIFFLSIIGVIKEIYPIHYEKRLKQMENESKNSKVSEQPSKHKLRKCVNNNQRLLDLDLSDDEENNNEQSESQTTIQKQNIENLDTRGSRRLRQKCKINYNLIYTDSSPKNLKKKEPKKKPIVAPRRKQPQRNLKAKNSKKMILDSDSQESLSESLESETEQRSGGMNLDNYQYISDDETNGNRKILRSSSNRR